jgi:hypothetical protein
MSIAQANRQLRIKTPLGADKLLLYPLQARECEERVNLKSGLVLKKDATAVLRGDHVNVTSESLLKLNC